MIRLKFSNHAQMRFTERGLDMDHIKAAVREPDLTENLADGMVRVLKKLEGGRRIRVVYSKDGTLRGTTDYLILTAYYI